MNRRILSVLSRTGEQITFFYNQSEFDVYNTLLDLNFSDETAMTAATEFKNKKAELRAQALSEILRKAHENVAAGIITSITGKKGEVYYITVFDDLKTIIKKYELATRKKVSVDMGAIIKRECDKLLEEKIEYAVMQPYPTIKGKVYGK